MKRKLVRGLAAFALCLAGGAGPLAASPVVDEIGRLADAIDGNVGVAAWTLDAPATQVLFNADQRFPMASTFKVAVAGAVLARVDRGELSLDTMLPVPHAAYVPSEPIAVSFPHPGVSLSLHNLLEVMLVHSDNTATDVLVDAAGGAAAVTAWLRAQGVEDQRVDRDTAGLIRDFFGLGPGPLEQAFEQAQEQDPALAARMYAPDPAFDDDPRDTSTPLAMAQLLQRLFAGDALAAGSTRELGEIMARCQTCDARLRGRMPPGTAVADKTGTIGGSVNSVGVIDLPDGRRLAIAVFIKRSAAPVPERERTIAEIARAVRDHFVLGPAAGP